MTTRASHLSKSRDRSGRRCIIRRSGAIVAALASLLVSTTPYATAFVVGPTTSGALVKTHPSSRPSRFELATQDTDAIAPSWRPSYSRERISHPLPAWRSPGEYGDDDDDLRDDWQTLKRAAGNIVRKTGNKLRKVVEEGGDKLKSLISANETTKKTDDSDRETLVQGRRLQRSGSDYDGLYGGGGGLSELFLGIPDWTLGSLAERGSGSLFGSDLSKALLDDVLEHAKSLLRTDPAAQSLLGKPLTIGPPFSQQSRMTTVNSKTRSAVTASFEVVGPLGSAVASVTSSDGKIKSLGFEAVGRRYEVDVGGGGRGKAGSKRSARTNNVIDAEIVQ